MQWFKLLCVDMRYLIGLYMSLGVHMGRVDPMNPVNPIQTNRKIRVGLGERVNRTDFTAIQPFSVRVSDLGQIHQTQPEIQTYVYYLLFKKYLCNLCMTKV